MFQTKLKLHEIYNLSVWSNILYRLLVHFLPIRLPNQVAAHEQLVMYFFRRCGVC